MSMTAPIRLFARWTCAALVALALPAWADMSRDDAVAAAQRMGGGRVLSVEKSESGRRLLIEDEAPLRLTLARQLEADGYRVDQAKDGEDGLFQASEYPVDLAIVDLGLPKLNGLKVVQRLRADGRTIPILILTARGSWQDKVVGLEAGADDYLVKPFEYPELAARVKALLRRSLKAATDVLTFGPISIDVSAQLAKLDGADLALTTFEFRVLEYLVRDRARVVSKQELSDYLYPHDEDRDSNVLEVLVGRLRRKLDPQGTLNPIETLRGRGYRFALE
jgi:two-component system response regulator PhoP